PLTACVFVLEVIRVGAMGYHALLPCLCASCAAFLTADALGAEALRFDLSAVPEPDWLALGQVVCLAALCAIVGVALCVCLEKGAHLFKRAVPNAYVRVALGGALMAIIVWAFGAYDYAGAGTGVIVRAVAGEVRPWTFAVKLALTTLCVAAGFRGGEIVPTLFIGATFGCAVGPLLGLEPGFAACLGMICLFCAVVNCPMASLFLAAELFGTHQLVPFAVAVAVTFALSGRFGLYESQVYQLREETGEEG
ncbi:MAG: chloride channel protein, partial [Muribaculaceae bacterium]|nr:chloride channel protein [Muribaculaceae bacterium]